MFNTIGLAGMRKGVQGRKTTTAKCPYFQEIVQCLYPAERDGITSDLRLYEATGMLTERLEDVLRRASILRDADRLLAKFPEEEIELAA